MELGHELDEDSKNQYSKITWDGKGIEELLCQLFLDSFEKPPETLILDFDAADIPIHSDQQRRFFHGYYDHYCCLPLYVFCDDSPLIARLRPSSMDACEGTEEILVRAEKFFGKSGEAEHVFSRFSWKTRSRWSRNRDIIARAEQLPGKRNSRFIVTDIPAEEGDAKSLAGHLDTNLTDHLNGNKNG